MIPSTSLLVGFKPRICIPRTMSSTCIKPSLSSSMKSKDSFISVNEYGQQWMEAKSWLCDIVLNKHKYTSTYFKVCFLQTSKERVISFLPNASFSFFEIVDMFGAILLINFGVALVENNVKAGLCNDPPPKKVNHIMLQNCILFFTYNGNVTIANQRLFRVTKLTNLANISSKNHTKPIKIRLSIFCIYMLKKKPRTCFFMGNVCDSNNLIYLLLWCYWLVPLFWWYC